MEIPTHSYIIWFSLSLELKHLITQSVMSKYSSLFLADSFAITLANNPFTLVSVVVLQCLIKNRTSIKEIICTLICEKKMAAAPQITLKSHQKVLSYSWDTPSSGHVRVCYHSMFIQWLIREDYNIVVWDKAQWIRNDCKMFSALCNKKEQKSLDLWMTAGMTAVLQSGSPQLGLWIWVFAGKGYWFIQR